MSEGNPGGGRTSSLSRRGSDSVGPPRKPLPEPGAAGDASPSVPVKKPSKPPPSPASRASTGTLLKGRPPPPKHLRGSGRGGSLPGSPLQGRAKPPPKMPPLPPAARDASPLNRASETAVSSSGARVASPTTMSRRSEGNTSGGSWKGVTLRSSAARTSGTVMMARTRGATVMSSTDSASNSGSSTAATSPRTDPESGTSPPTDSTAEVTLSRRMETGETGTMSRRWSFLEDTEEQASDNAQCFIWGIMGKQVRTVPKPPRLDSLGEANVKRVVGGVDHFLLLTDTGQVYAWGHGSAGALGVTDTMPRLSPVLVQSLANHQVTHIAAMARHSAALTDRGVLYHWGTIGVAGMPMVTMPKTRTELKGYVLDAVELGDNFVLGLLRGGDLIAWGDNSQGQLGCAPTVNVSLNPITFSLEEKVARIACGATVAGAVTLRNNAFYWGANWAKPQRPHRTPQRIIIKSKAQSLAFGARHALLLSVDGRVYVMGDNARFQLGLPTPEEHRAHFVLQPMSDGMDEEEGPPLPSPVVTRKEPSMSIAGSPGGTTFRFKGLKGGLRRNASANSKSGSGSSSNLLSPSSASDTSGGGGGGGGGSSGVNGGDYIRIKQIAAGAMHSAVLTHAGKVYEWGQMSVLQDASKETRTQLKPTPIIVESLDGVSIDELTCSRNAVLAVVGLRNERDLKFLSFNPPIVKAGSLERLIDWLVRDSRSAVDTFDYDFFLTLSTFTSPTEVLQLLVNRLTSDRTLETRIVSIVYKWMRKRPDDFHDDNTQEMVKQLVSDAADLRVAINKQLSVLGQMRLRQRSRSQSTGDTMPASSLDVMRCDPHRVAEQLTLIEEALIGEMNARELLHNAWSKRDKEERAPNVLRIIGNFNRISYFVTTFIVSGTSTEERSRRAQFWGDVLKHAYQLNNLNTSMAISSAFQSVPLHRLLKRNLVEYKASAQRVIEALGGLMKGNKTGYRRRMESFLSSGEPAIPYLAVHLSDLTFLEDGNPSFVDDLINMQKRHLIGKQIGPLEKLQSRRYSTFHPDPELRAYLMRVEGYEETALDHLVEKIIGQDKMQSSGGAPQATPSYGSLANRSEQMLLLETEARKTEDARVQVWKEWFLCFSERGADFMQTWRSSQAWEQTLYNLLEHPFRSKRESELFVDVLGKMMPGAAPYLPAAVSALAECAKAEPQQDLQDAIVAALSCFKSPLLDSRGLASQEASSSASLASESHADILAAMQKDRRRLARLQPALMAPAPPAEEEEALRKVAIKMENQIPAVEQVISERQEEFAEMKEEEIEASERFTVQLTTMDERLEVLQKREAELLRELEEVQKEMAETLESRKDLSKKGEHEMSSIAMRKRIVDGEVVERSKLVDALRRAVASWGRFAGAELIQFVGAANVAHGEVHAWLESRLQRIYLLLEVYRNNLERAADELAARGDASLLASEAWKVAREEAAAFLKEAAQFLAAFPTTLLEIHAKLLDTIVLLREDVQTLCGQDQAAVAAERSSQVMGGRPSLGRSSLKASASPTTASPITPPRKPLPTVFQQAAEPEEPEEEDEEEEAESSDHDNKDDEPAAAAATAPGDDEVFVLPSQRLVLGPAAPAATRAERNSGHDFVLPSTRFEPS